jgi:hypothetical protein
MESEDNGVGNNRMNNRWTDNETCKLLDVNKKIDVIAMLDSKRQQNSVIFKEIATRLGTGKTADQCRCKWKGLKTRYKEELVKTNKSGKWLFVGRS